MNLEITVAHDAQGTRVVLAGRPRIGHLLSLLQVLEIDSADWRHPAVLLDLRGMHTRLSAAEQASLAAEATHCLRRLKRVAFLAPAGRLREGGIVRVFEEEADALRWLESARS